MVQQNNLVNELRLHSDHNRQGEWPYQLLKRAADELERIEEEKTQQALIYSQRLTKLIMENNRLKAKDPLEE